MQLIIYVMIIVYLSSLGLLKLYAMQLCCKHMHKVLMWERRHNHARAWKRDIYYFILHIWDDFENPKRSTS
jgi:hypothetical protein